MSKAYTDSLSTTIRCGISTEAEDALADAAPDLLEACKEIDKAMSGAKITVPAGCIDIPAAVDMLRAAIAKAEGR